MDIHDGVRFANIALSLFVFYGIYIITRLLDSYVYEPLCFNSLSTYLYKSVPNSIARRLYSKLVHILLVSLTLIGLYAMFFIKNVCDMTYVNSLNPDERLCGVLLFMIIQLYRNIRYSSAR